MPETLPSNSEAPFGLAPPARETSMTFTRADNSKGLYRLSGILIRGLFTKPTG